MTHEKDKETMKEKMHNAGEKIKEKGHEMKEDIKEGAEKVKEKAHEIKEDIKAKAKTAKAKHDMKENEKKRTA
ncbi:unknown [Fusobacterium sp. CAG:439]|nr:unknown [Fusobacterium sp. CAG:439]